MIGIIFNGRYRMDAELGRGGVGVVYRAYDTLLNRTVAVKVLSAAKGELGTQDKARLLAEAQAIASLNHPNIISVYDAGEADGQPFIVMELVNGESLRKHAPITLEQIFQVARQICNALEHAHAAGIIHRDLKPENIILTQSLTVKLMDFGLARRSSAAHLTEEDTIVGTFLYIAPELLMGMVASPQSDLYSLGVMLYELVTGQPPFTGENIISMVSQHLYATVVPPSTHNSSIPSALESLILRLLSKNPGERPTSAADVRQMLEQMEKGEIDPGAEIPQTGSLLNRIVRGRLVAREREFSEAKVHWQQAVSGKGQVLLISGEPGIGKTRLMHEVATYVDLGGGKALVSECYAEGGAPYAPITQIIQSLEEQELKTISGLALADLLTLAPTLYARYPSVPLNPPLGPQAEQQRMFESVVELFKALTTRAPILLAIDDAHWADSGTLALLRHLARRGRKLRLLILLTYREVELDENLAFHDTLANLIHERIVARIKLNRFTIEQTGDMLAVVFQRQAVPEFLASMYRETEGNPFFIEEVCKALIEQGVIFRRDGRWEREVSMDKIQIPQSVRLAIQARVGRLPASAQEVLQMAAILGREFDFDTLHESSELDEKVLVDALEIAEKAQLINEVRQARQERYAFSHALIPTTLRESVSGVRRHRLHRRAANALEALHPEDFESLAYHYDEAGDDENSRTYYMRAAFRAQKLYAHEDAIRFYSAALALTPENLPDRFNLLAARVKVYDIVGRRESQRADIETMLALSEKLDNDAYRCDALIALADFYIATEVMQAEAPARRAVEIARRLGDRVREGRALRNAGFVLWSALKYRESRSHLEASVACFREANLLNELAASLSQLSLTLRQLFEISAAQAALEEVVMLSRQTGDKSEEGTALRRMATLHLYQHNDAEAALPLAKAGLALHQATGDRRQEANSHNVLAGVYSSLKQLEAAEEHYCQFLDISEAIEDHSGIVGAASQLVFLLAVNGDYEAAVLLVDEYLQHTQHGGENFFIRMRNQKKDPLVYLGQYQQALELAEAYAAFAEQSLGQVAQAFALKDVVRVQIYLGRYAEARDNLDRAWEILTQPELPVSNLTAILVWRAYLAWRENTTDSLHSGLEDVKRIFKILRDENPAPGVAGGYLGLTHLFSARIHLALNEPEAALADSAESLRVRSNWWWFDDSSEQYYITHSRALRANRREAEADEYLQKAYERVMLVANKTEGETFRRSWLENVSDNREILAEWEMRLKEHEGKGSQ